jgi:hypothetical protein
MNKIKTYLVNELNPSINLGPSGISGYKGFFYHLSGSGGQNGSNTYINYGGSAGFVNSGYIDFNYPYSIESIDLQTNLSSPTSLTINYKPDIIGPTGGPPVISADKGSLFEYTNIAGAGAPLVPATKDVNNLGLSYNQVGYFTGGLEIITTSSSKYDVYDQRQNLYSGSSGPTGFNSSGNVCSFYGNNISGVLGGAGFYGANGATGESYGFSSGNYINDNYGYGVISLIPNDFILDNLFITDSTGSTGLSNMVLYSLVGGGGGGGGWSADNSSNARGGGGGGAGDMICGFFQSNILNISIGKGGTGGGEMTNGETGGNTVLNSIISYGGSGGGYNSVFDTSIIVPPNISGAGGPGYYGGGGGVGGYDDSQNFVYSYGGGSYTNMSSYVGKYGVAVSGSNNTAGLGAGAVSSDYGYAPQNIFNDNESGGGGGGGFWGGNGTYNGAIYNNFKDAQGYGCGGGGGSQNFGSSDISGGAGSNGYAIISYINTLHENIKVYKIESNKIFNFDVLDTLKGFWFFLSGNGATSPFGGGKSYSNTGHFLVNEDGVSQIIITKSSGYFNIQINFNTLINQSSQIFNLKANSTQPYMMLMFYL